MSSELESDTVYGWCHLVKATEVTAGLAESNGSLYRRVDGLKSHMRADCLYTGISSGPNQRSVSDNFTFLPML